LLFGRAIPTLARGGFSLIGTGPLEMEEGFNPSLNDFFVVVIFWSSILLAFLQGCAGAVWIMPDRQSSSTRQ
jgi:hypothetical protein